MIAAVLSPWILENNKSFIYYIYASLLSRCVLLVAISGSRQDAIEHGRDDRRQIVVLDAL